MNIDLEQMIGIAIANHTKEELALGYLRYDIVRRMEPKTFGSLHRLNLSGTAFDDLIDEAIKQLNTV